jgi:probable selenium-dependent hydroxylase accessory protein YqeC
MRLAEAIGLRSTEALACVGAGGKTTLCWRVWMDCTSAGQPSIFTLTTHILEPILPPAAALLLTVKPDPDTIQTIMRGQTSLILAASRLANAPIDVAPNPVAPTRSIKLAGLPPQQIDQLIENLPGVTWLIEADGARGRGLKIPAAHEPAIPARCAVVAVLAHLDTIGLTLNAAAAHRPERVAERLRMQLGDRITAEHVARLMTDPAGGLKDIPASARAVAVLNQRDPTQPHPQARSIADALLACGRYTRVVVGSLRAEQPVLEVLTA